ncbi:MAG: carboxymuconolactone decarboxylase family protein [Mycobacteriaceae bacterium]|nr:carboxymuconolactone decarboxylase family protein [Mycobacteriaceae bacterium]
MRARRACRSPRRCRRDRAHRDRPAGRTASRSAVSSRSRTPRVPGCTTSRRSRCRSRALADLIKIRASQINHCAFCCDMHSHDARKTGMSEQKLALTPAWDEAGGLYTERERAALALTEAITDLTGHQPVSDEVYSRASAVFSERELGQVIAMAVTINAWNRVGVTTRLAPPRRS